MLTRGSPAQNQCAAAVRCTAGFGGDYLFLLTRTRVGTPLDPTEGAPDRSIDLRRFIRRATADRSPRPGPGAAPPLAQPEAARDRSIAPRRFIRGATADRPPRTVRGPPVVPRDPKSPGGVLLWQLNLDQTDRGSGWVGYSMSCSPG